MVFELTDLSPMLLFFVAVVGAFISFIAGAGGLLVLPVLFWLGVPLVSNRSERSSSVVAVYLGFSPRASDKIVRLGWKALISTLWLAVELDFTVGFFGPGMGAFCAAAFAGLKGYNMRRATGSTKSVALIVNLVSAVVFVFSGHV